MRKKTINWAVVLYVEMRGEQERVKYGTREKLIERAIVKFGIKGDFDVPT